ncbi:MAG: hypothetical protein ABI200_00370 [Gaiellales bacterium]
MHRDPTEDAAPRTMEQGQTMAEYAVVLTVITTTVIATIILLGNTTGIAIEKIAARLG